LTGTSINPPGTPCQVRQRVPGFFLLALTSAGVIAADLSPDRMDFLTATSSAHRLPGPFRPVRKHFVVSLQVTSLAVSIALGRAQAEQGREISFADERRVVTPKRTIEKGYPSSAHRPERPLTAMARMAGMAPLPAIRWPSAPNGGFDRLATPGSDPDLPVELSQSGRSSQRPTCRKRPLVSSRRFGHLSGRFELGPVSERRAATGQKQSPKSPGGLSRLEAV